MEQYLQPAPIHRDFTQHSSSLKNNCISDPETNPSNGFECNICLDLVRDPVVTFCGHLYCWPCIYRWISFRHDDDDDNLTVENQKPQCPVCKREVSEKTIIPLYGRGQNNNSSKGEISHPIPQRPKSPRCGANALLLPNSGDNLRQFRNRGYLEPSRAFDAGVNYRRLGAITSPLVDPMIGMFGEMVYARIFGNSETTLYTYPNSYRSAGSSSPRVRRQMMQADESLSRVCFFLCCCVMLCLLLF